MRARHSGLDQRWRARRPVRFPSLCLAVATLTAAALTRATDGVPATPAETQQELRSLANLGSVLYVAAHPDDENNGLLAYLARGRGYRTAYLSDTRGDGGQNEIGREFGEKLGLARTHELLAARRVDGARQYFTRALDFGYSKDVQETLRIWGHREVLGDVVRVYRMFRPDLVIVGMSPVQTPGSHGQHVASAVLAIEAFKLAGDPKAYPEQLAEGLTPWQPKRLLGRSGGGRGGPGGRGGRGGPGGAGGAPASPGSIQVGPGGTDPATGEDLSVIARRSRSMHKTQFGLNFGAAGGGPGMVMGALAVIGGEPAKQDIFEGIDLTFARFPGGADVARLAEKAVAEFRIEDPAASVPALMALRTKLAGLEDNPVVADKRAQLDRILQACLGLTIETTLPRAEEVPGEALPLSHSVSARAAVPVRWVSMRYPTAHRDEAVGVQLKPGVVAQRAVSVVLPAGTPVSQPYWLREEAVAGLFRVDDPKLIGRPLNPPAFPVEFVLEVAGQKLVLADEPVQIMPDAPEAQRRRPLAVIPPVSLAFPYEVELFAPGVPKATVVEVAAARAQAKGTVRLAVPPGWTVDPVVQPFTLAQVGSKARFTFRVTPPARPSSGSVQATAEVGGVTYGTQRTSFSYSHLPVLLLQPPARLRVAAFEVAVRGRTVGYLPGAGDSVAESLEQLGYSVKVLSGADLTPEKLRGLDAVVLGVRAFNERRDLATGLPGLFAWVEGGGTLIVQYNRPSSNLRGPLAPFELSIAGDAPSLRVTDENAPVTLLQPEHRALNTPNKIGPADFEGWVQERGAYFPSRWDEQRFQSLLAMSDPGEKQPNSSLLVARHGRGYYVYTGLAFFRQLPAGVPGAYRLFANLVSLGQ